MSLAERGFWDLNKGKLKRFTAVCLASGMACMGAGALWGWASGKFSTDPIELVLYGAAMGACIAGLILLGSWFAFAKIGKRIDAISLADRAGFQDLRLEYSDNGSKWEFFEKSIAGTYLEIPFSLKYYALYHQADDRRGYHIRLGMEGGESLIILGLGEIESLGRLELKDLLDRAIARAAT